MAQPLAGFPRPRDPGLGLGLMCKEEEVRQGTTGRETEVVKWARDGEMERGDGRRQAKWGAEARQGRGDARGGTSSAGTVAETVAEAGTERWKEGKGRLPEKEAGPRLYQVQRGRWEKEAGVRTQGLRGARAGGG